MSTINVEWTEYYEALEQIRLSGVCNMWGASTYLKEFYPELSHDTCKEILCSWISNYSELAFRFGWRK